MYRYTHKSLSQHIRIVGFLSKRVHSYTYRYDVFVVSCQKRLTVTYTLYCTLLPYVTFFDSVMVRTCFGNVRESVSEACQRNRGTVYVGVKKVILVSVRKVRMLVGTVDSYY